MIAQNRLRGRRLTCSLVLVLLIGSFLAVAVGHAGQGWSHPINLSESVAGPSQWPRVAVDSSQHLHLVWSENSNLDRGIPDAIYYRFFDGAQWSAPHDVLVSPVGGEIYTARLLVSPEDELQLLWIGGNQLFFSAALVERAGFPAGWSTTNLNVGTSATSPDMQRAPNGVLYAAYVDLTSLSLFVISSNDEGWTWSQPQLIWAAPTSNSAPFTPKICVDQTRVIHVLWTENAKEFGWNPAGIWYSRSLDGGETWVNTYNLSDQGSTAGCGFDAQGNLHVVWNHGVGSQDGRYHMMSTDGGVSWSLPEVIFRGLSGRTRFPALALDSGDTLHLVFGAYGGERGYDSRMYWSYWTGYRWSDPVAISDKLPSNESPELVVRQGNILDAVWHFGESDKIAIWYSTMQTSSPHIEPKPAEVVHRSAQVIPAPSSTPGAVPPTMTSSATTIAPFSGETPPDTADNALPALMVSLLPAVTLVIAVVIVRQFRTRHH